MALYRLQTWNRISNRRKKYKRRNLEIVEEKSNFKNIKKDQIS